MNKSRRGFLAASGATAVAALGGCLGSSGSDSPAGNGTTTSSQQTTALKDVTYRHRYIRTGIGTAVNDAGVEFGLWEDEGLNVSFETSSGSQAAVKSVASGKDMFGNAGISSILSLNEEGADLVVIGQMLDPLGGVVTTGEQGIETWSDLEGKTVGQYPFGSTGVAAKAAMREDGVDLSKVTFQNVQPGNGEKLLLNGNLDAMIKFFPLSKERLVAEGLSPNVLISASVLDHLGISLFTRRSVVENKPGIVNKFVRGWLNAYQVFATDIERVLEMYKPLAAEGFTKELEIQRNSLDEYYAAQVPEPSIGNQHGKGWTVPEQVTGTIETFTDAGLLNGSLNAEDQYTNQFLEQNQELAVETATTIYDRLEDFDIGPNYI